MVLNGGSCKGITAPLLALRTRWLCLEYMETEGSLGTFRRLFQPWRLSDASAKYCYMFKAILWGLIGSEILWVG